MVVNEFGDYIFPFFTNLLIFLYKKLLKYGNFYYIAVIL